MNLRHNAVQLFLSEYMPILQKLVDEISYKPLYYEEKIKGKMCVYEEDNYHFYMKREPTRWVGWVSIGRWVVEGKEKEGVLFAYGRVSSFRFSEWNEEVKEKIRRRLNLCLGRVMTELVAERVGTKVAGNGEILTGNGEIKITCSPEGVVVHWKPEGKKKWNKYFVSDWGDPKETVNKIAALVAVSFL